MIDPFVSVIVPVRNEEAHLAETLAPLLAQRYDGSRFEIIVVDGRSTDATVDIVQRMMIDHPQLQLLDNAKGLSSAARNVGILHSCGDYIAIVDGHCELRNLNYFRDLVRAFQVHGADCLGRPQPLDVAQATLLQRAVAIARASRLGHNPGSHIYDAVGGIVKPQSVAVAYRRDVFERVGLFDESFDACEDVEFNHRVDAAGLTCYLAPELTVYYRPRETLKGLAYQMQRYGRGRAKLLLKHPETFSAPPLVPAVFLCVLALAFGMGLVAQPFAVLFCLTALCYSLTVMAMSLLLTPRHGAHALLTPVVFLAIHVGAGWGVLAVLLPAMARSMLRILRPAARNLGPA